MAQKKELGRVRFKELAEAKIIKREVVRNDNAVSYNLHTSTSQIYYVAWFIIYDKIFNFFQHRMFVNGIKMIELSLERIRALSQLTFDW